MAAGENPTGFEAGGNTRNETPGNTRIDTPDAVEPRAANQCVRSPQTCDALVEAGA
ncbi:protein of unknown function [Pararobbsia alpina]